MGSPKIYMITGLHDVRWLPNVLQNFERQTYKYKHLIIVENGAGSGVCSTLVLSKKVEVLYSKPGPSEPLNAALRYLRKEHGDSWFCKCDADDYYGPGYLNSILPAYRAGADYAGRASLYVRPMNHHLWFIERPADSYIFHGPTLCGRVASALDFPLTNDWGEDDAWCRAMHRDGRKPFTLRPEQFCYNRYSDYSHAWPCTDMELRTSWQVPIIDLGEYDTAIIDGARERPSGTILHTPNVTVDNFMPMRLLKEKLRSENVR